MNKSALKKFSTEARRELLERVELQARKIGITKDLIQTANVESSDAVFIDGIHLSHVERKQRNKLIARIDEIGFERVVDETAYTWFNRFVALRFMEVNEYLPTKVRVLSSSNEESVEPDMMREALSLDLDMDKELVYELKMNNDTDGLFKYLIKVHCNDLNRYMPFMFESIEDYKEILFPEGLLGTDSFVRKMTNHDVVAESDWKNVEIIGWLYQYYISEEKDKVFANLKKNIKISKENIPAATQLFTPNWIVKYMVENSLGRIWYDNYPNTALKSNWKYFLDEEPQIETTKKQLESIKLQNINPEEIKFLDPCCGSGHILTYAFDIFYEIYLERGYVNSEIPQLILNNNLFGIDIDNRAVQLASFAITMKARSKSRRLFRENIQLNICSIQESNWLTDEMIENFAKIEDKDMDVIKEIMHDIQNTFMDAKEFGSIVSFNNNHLNILTDHFNLFIKKDVNLIDMIDQKIIADKLPDLIAQSKMLSDKYDVVCTNPPYMSSAGMGENLSNFLKKKFPDSKSDLSTVFMEKSFQLCKSNGYVSMLNIPSWMFLNSYEKLRYKLIRNKTIVNMLHFGRGVFGSDFGTVAFVISNYNILKYKASYKRLFRKAGSVDNLLQKEEWFFSTFGNYYFEKEDFFKLPGQPIAYWISEDVAEVFVTNDSLRDFAEPRQGLATGNDAEFLRFWHEISYPDLGLEYDNKDRFWADSKKYAPFNKGGAYRKWYGNNDFVIKFDLKNYEKLLKQGNKLPSRHYYFKEGITWTALTSSEFSARYCENGFVFAGKGPMCFPNDSSNIYYLTGLLNSKINGYFMGLFSMTMDFTQGALRNIPIIKPEDPDIIDDLVKQNIEISKMDWDYFENSLGFKKHPLLINKDDSDNNISSLFAKWENKCEIQFENLKMNEEKLNETFIKLYKLEKEMTPELATNEVTIRKAELERDIKSFISYAIGCLLGRFTLDQEGIVYAGGEFNRSLYQMFSVDEDNILPILSGEYFEDDIVTKVVDFVRVTFSEEALEENLSFIADALGRKSNETSRETLRRYFLNDFYKDHVQTYKKRPIYWLFTSGKEKAFNCLIYMHRYDKTTLSRIRTDYLHEVQNRMDAEKKDLLAVIEGDSTTKEISNSKKILKSLDKKIDELKAYDELLHHMADQQIEIDLDDGVKVNYEKFKGLVAKIN